MVVFGGHDHETISIVDRVGEGGMLDVGPFVVSRKSQLDQVDEVGFNIGLFAETSRDQPGYRNTARLFADGSENDGYPVRAFGHGVPSDREVPTYTAAKPIESEEGRDQIG